MTEGGDPNTAGNAVFNVPLINGQARAFAWSIYNDDRAAISTTSTASSPHQTWISATSYFGIHPTARHLPGRCAGREAYQRAARSGAHCRTRPSATTSTWSAIDQNPVTHQGARASCALQHRRRLGRAHHREPAKARCRRTCPSNIPIGSEFPDPEATASDVVLARPTTRTNTPTPPGRSMARSAICSLIYTGGYADVTSISRWNTRTTRRTCYGVYYRCTGGTSRIRRSTQAAR